MENARSLSGLILTFALRLVLQAGAPAPAQITVFDGTPLTIGPESPVAVEI